MRRVLLVLFAVLLASTGIARSHGTLAAGTSRTTAPTAAIKCTAGAKLVNGRCVQKRVKAKTLTLKGVQVAGFTAVDAQGNIYSDSGTTSVVKFSPAGTILAQWDGLHADGDRPDPAGGIAIDTQGNVYVADTDANSVVKLSSNLQLLARWGGYGQAPGQFVAPEGIALDAQGNIYVADSGNARVQKLAPDGSVLAVLGDKADLRSPQAVTVDSQGTVYVLDTEQNRVIELSPSGQRLSVVDLHSVNYGYGDDLAVDRSGRVYVSDYGNKEILKLSPSGKLLNFYWLDPLSIYTPLGLALSPKGAVYASECPAEPGYPQLCREVKFDGGGHTVTIWKSGAGPAQPGAKLDIGGYGLYLHCVGKGSPTVILEPDYGGDSSEWSYIQAQLAPQMQVCAYDPAGSGLSDQRPASAATSNVQTAMELHALLQKAQIPGPYVLAGHAWGGGVARLFAYTYPKDVAGMVLIDSIDENQFGPDQLDAYPDLVAMLQGLKEGSRGTVKGSLGDIPLITLTQNADLSSCVDCYAPGTTWYPWQRELASASSNSVEVMALRSGDSIPWVQPALAIEAIREVVDAVRAPSHVLPACGSNFEALGGNCLS